MGQLFGIINLCGNLAVIFPCKMAKHVFITFFTGTQYDNLDIILTQLIHHVCNQIEALLVSQSGYDTD